MFYNKLYYYISDFIIGNTYIEIKGRVDSKCKYKFEAPIEAVLEFEEEDEWNGLPISTPPYIICAKCHFDKCVPLDYKSKRGYHHIYKIK